MERKITIETIETKEFHVAARGYNQREVDEFLDAICDEIEQMEAHIAKLENDLSMAKAVERKNEAASGIVMPAETSVSLDKVIQNAIRAAEAEADQITKAAEIKASEIVAEAQAKAAEKLGNLEEEQKGLVEKVEMLKNSIKEYRSRFEGLLRAQQDVLAQINDI